MAKITSFTTTGGSNLPDDPHKIDKEKFKQKMKQVEAVEKTDVDQKAKKRKPEKEEEDQTEAEEALGQSAPPQAPLGSMPAPQTPPQAPEDISAPEGYTPTGNVSSPPPEAPFPDLSDNIDYDYPDIPEDYQGDYSNVDFNQTQGGEPTASTQRPSQENKKLSKEEIKKLEKASFEKKRVSSEMKAKKMEAGQAFAKNEKLSNQPRKLTDEEAYSLGLKQKPTLRSDEEIYKDLKQTTVKHEPFEIKESVHQGTHSFEMVPTHKEKKKTTSKIQKDNEGFTDKSAEISLPGQALPPMIQAPKAPDAPPPAGYLTPEVHELFQTMVGLVMVKQMMHEGFSGTQTEVTLNNPEFQNSQFYGLKIVITEYKTAPGAYNIELQGTNAQNTVLNATANKLISALNDNRYNLPFTVNRLDISVKKEESDFLFKRKESVKGGEKDLNDRQNQ